MFQVDQIARDQNPVPGWKLEIEPDLNVDAFFLRSPNPATKQQSPLRPSPAARDCHVHIVFVRACRRKVTITQRMTLFSALLPFCLVLSAIEAVQATRPRMSASSLNALPASRIDEIPRMQLLSLLRDEPTLGGRCARIHVATAVEVIVDLRGAADHPAIEEYARQHSATQSAFHLGPIVPAAFVLRRVCLLTFGRNGRGNSLFTARWDRRLRHRRR